MSAHNGTFNKLKIANKKAKEEFKKFKASAVTLDLSCSELNYELEYLKNMVFGDFSEVLLEDIFDVETGVKTFIVMHTPERLSSILNLFLQRTLQLRKHNMLSINFKSLLTKTPYNLIPQSHWNYISKDPAPLDVEDWVESMKDFEL